MYKTWLFYIFYLILKKRYNFSLVNDACREKKIMKEYTEFTKSLKTIGTYIIRRRIHYSYKSIVILGLDSEVVGLIIIMLLYRL